MSQAFIGEIRMFGSNFAPRFWAFCNGQLLSISQNTALFSLLGTNYGGNGTTNFALPDLRGRVPIHWGQGPGLSSYSLGEMGGVETVTLLPQQLPPHTHPLAASAGPASPTAQPGGSMMAAANAPLYASALTQPAAMSVQAISTVGGSQPHENVAPSLCVSFIICLQGIFPSRN